MLIDGDQRTRLLPTLIFSALLYTQSPEIARPQVKSAQYRSSERWRKILPLGPEKLLLNI
jgi:hypothetical protein